MFIKKMSIIPKKYRKSNSIQLNLSNVDLNQLKLSISANLNTGYLNISQIGDNIKSIVPTIFDSFTTKIAQEIENIRKQFSLDKKSAFLEATALDKKNLSNLSDEKKIKLFKSIIPIFLPALKGYIKRRILSAKRADLKSLSNIDSKDVVNEVVLRVHSTYKNNIKDIKNINIWIIQEADNVLNEILDNNTSDNVSFEELVNNELGQLEEEYTIDGGGDLVMTDELDEYDIDFGVEEIILSTKGENDFIDKLDISKVKLKDRIYDELIKLPLRYQSIYDLYFFEHMDFDEIAIIKDMESIEVEAVIISIKELLSEKLFY
jgi:DNA-directed RNA polymerase specialized sigma24 family protein